MEVSNLSYMSMPSVWLVQSSGCAQPSTCHTAIFPNERQKAESNIPHHSTLNEPRYPCVCITTRLPWWSTGAEPLKNIEATSLMPKIPEGGVALRKTLNINSYDEERLFEDQWQRNALLARPPGKKGKAPSTRLHSHRLAQGFFALTPLSYCHSSIHT